ncbi:MAG: hypothetical protein MUO33_07025, partial [Sedimentisphaerales bacterium]|nr:hypothetical protein [Sedimentisphaerales bacterium]
MNRSRREFLKAVAAVTAMSSQLKDLQTASHAQQALKKSIGKIKTIETFTQGPVSIVRVRTDSGAEGCGQIAPFNADISALVLHRQIAPHV